MFSIALLVRILIAPHVGFYSDLNYFQTWAGELARVGPHRFYSVDRLADYPPGYLYMLWLIGKISATPGYLLIKLPPILADLGLAWVAGVFASRLAPASVTQRVPVRAAVAAAVLFNPAVIALSAVWGQVDVVPTFVVLSSLLLLFTGKRSAQRELAAFLLFGVAFAVKPQTGFALPVMVYVLYRRHLHRRAGWELVDGALAVAWIGIGSLGVWAASGLAFGLGPVALYHFFSHSASVHPVTSANAFNLWGALGFWRNDSTGDHVMTIAGIPALRFGMLTFAASVALVLWHVHRAIRRGADEARVLTVGAAATSLLAYVLLTRMHERYMFLSLACLAPLVFARPLRLAYAGLSGLFLLNLWYPYAYFNSQSHVQDFHYEPWFNWILGGFATDTWQRTLWSIAVTAIAFTVVWAGLRWADPWRPEIEPAPAGPAPGPAPPLRHPRSIGSVREGTATAASTSSSRRWPIGLAGLTCLFSLVILRGETRVAENLNDSAFHLLMVRWASGQIHEGRLPLDGWFPYLSLGSSFFHHYQSLPQTLTALIAVATGAGVQTAYLWLQYLLVALWPIAVYIGARLLEWDRWTAGTAAAVSPLLVSTPGYGFEHLSYVWQGYGVYSQLWAMWLLPIAWGLTWRALARGRYFAAAAAATALTMACHFIVGYLAILTVGVWVIVLGGGFLRRAGRAALVAGGSMLIAAWALVPLIGDTKWTNQSVYYRGTIFNNSYGAHTVLHWLFHGQLFDAGRFPVITLLVFAGVLACLLGARRDARARALLGAFALGLCLFFGRPTWGRLLDLLPGFGDIQIHRFIIGVDLAGILLAGVGLGWVLRVAHSAARRLLPGRYGPAAGAAVLLLAVGVLAPAWTERIRFDKRGAELIRTQRTYDATDGRDLDRLIAIVQSRHDGRVYAGLRGNWGQEYKVGYVPVHAWLADRGVDAIGFSFRTVPSLSTDVESAFDETNPAQYQMLNVRYLILPEDRPPPVPATLVARGGRHRLWEVKTSGYCQVVDRSAAVAADRTDVPTATLAFRSSDFASRGIYPGVAFAGGTAPPPTFAGATPPAGPAGNVIAQSNELQDGVFSATVVARRPAVVLLKASYDPRWTVTVDGVAARPSMMAPSLVGAEVPTGVHVVRFRYKPYAGYPLLLAIGAITLLALVLVPRRGGLDRRAGGQRLPARRSATIARGGSGGEPAKFSSSLTT
jgi:hypothetical protein